MAANWGISSVMYRPLGRRRPLRSISTLSLIHIYMMIVRTAIRCPLMLVFSFAMAFIMGGKMAVIFLLVIPVSVSYTHLDVYKRQVLH